MKKMAEFAPFLCGGLNRGGDQFSLSRALNGDCFKGYEPTLFHSRMHV